MKKGRGRPPAQKIPKKLSRPRKEDSEENAAPSPTKKVEEKKAGSFSNYESDVTPSSESELDAGAMSDECDDMNWRPYGEVRVKKRRDSGIKEREDKEDEAWRPGKVLDKHVKGPKASHKAKVVAGPGGPPKKRGRPPKGGAESEIAKSKDKKSGKGRGRPKKSAAPEEKDDDEKDEEDGDEKDEEDEEEAEDDAEEVEDGEEGDDEDDE